MIIDLLELILTDMIPELSSNKMKFTKEEVQVIIYFPKNKSNFIIEFKVENEIVKFFQEINNESQKLLIYIYNNIQKKLLEENHNNKVKNYDKFINSILLDKKIENYSYIKNLKQKDKIILVFDNKIKKEKNYITIYKNSINKYFNSFLVEWSFDISRYWDDNLKKFITNQYTVKKLFNNEQYNYFPLIKSYTNHNSPKLGNNIIKINEQEIVNSLIKLPESFITSFLLALNLENIVPNKEVKKNKNKI